MLLGVSKKKPGASWQIICTSHEILRNLCLDEKQTNVYGVKIA